MLSDFRWSLLWFVTSLDLALAKPAVGYLYQGVHQSVQQGDDVMSEVTSLRLWDQKAQSAQAAPGRGLGWAAAGTGAGGGHRGPWDVLGPDCSAAQAHQVSTGIRPGSGVMLPRSRWGLGSPHRPSGWAECPRGKQVLPGGHPMQAKPWGRGGGVDHAAVATTALQGWRLL